MRCAIISIGDEVVLGQICDTNSAWLADQLVRRGVLSVMHITVPDDAAAIRDALEAATEAADLVIATGGLGPTDDDLTRDALAALLQCELKLHEPSMRLIEAYFHARKRPMADLNRVQAMIPAAAEPLDNPFGTAPGIRADYHGVPMFFVPGVPSEMRGLFERHIEPFIQQHHATGAGGRFILAAKLHTFGEGESKVAELLGDLMRRDRNPTVGTTVSDSIVSVRIRSDSADLAQAQHALNETVNEARRRLGRIVFGEEDQTLQQAVGMLLRRAGRTVATAESCTGGLVGAMLTDVPGSSAWFAGGWVVYSNTMKQAELGVPETMLKQYGAVSEEVAVALAETARVKMSADFALSITGIAGPEGGTANKPVGTVWIALADRHRPTLAALHLLPGDRATVRDRSAKTALNMLRLRLLETI